MRYDRPTMKITICGLAGTGTSTLGKSLAEELRYDYLSSGDVFRSKAAELNMDLNEFEELCRRDPSYDKQLDAEIEKYGKNNNDFVVESRLAWHFIPDSFKVKLSCDFETRIARIAYRDEVSVDEARTKTTEREDAIRQRYYDYYGIEQFDADGYFDLILDTTHQPVSTLLEKLHSTLAERA